MVISKNQAHFKTLTAGQKKLIHLGEERISIDNLKVCLLVVPDSLGATKNRLWVQSDNRLVWISICWEVNHVCFVTPTKIFLFPLNYTLTWTSHQRVINNTFYRKIRSLTFKVINSFHSIKTILLHFGSQFTKIRNRVEFR